MPITNVHTRSMSPRSVHAVALLGSVPLVGVAVFQVSLGLGAPYGDAVLGGHAATVDGALTPPLRWAAAGQAALLLAMAWLLSAVAASSARALVDLIQLSARQKAPASRRGGRHGIGVC